MGAWGIGAFENDGAADLIAEWRHADAQAVIDALALGEGYIEVDDGQQVVAAATVIAAVFGEPAGKLPEDIARLAARDAKQLQSRGELPGVALERLRRVADDGSELAELWAETPSAEAWQSQMRALSRALEALKS